MKSILSKISLFLAVLLTLSCSKDDNKDNPINENGGIISRYQIVTVDTESVSLSNEEYNGTLGGSPIVLSKTGDHELVFYVAENLPLGESELIITDLNNTKIKYEIIDAVLSQSATATLTPFFTNFEDFNSGLSSTTANAAYISNYNNMLSYYDNLSEADKTEVARFYQVNKTVIDAVFLSDYSNVTAGRSPMSEIDMAANKLLVLKFKASLAVAIVGGTVAVLEPSNIIRPIAIGVAAAGISSALEYHFDLIDNNVNIIQIKINSILGTNGRTTNSALSFTDNVAQTIPFNVGAQQIVNSDSNSQQEYMRLYFETKNKLNTFVAKVNTSIEWVNNNIPLVSFSTIPLATLPDTATLEGFDVNNQIMQNLTLSINHPNLILQSATLQSDGMLNIKIKITGTPSSLPVSSTLNYSYADDFSGFSGSFPIVVNDTSICGEFEDIDGNIYQSVTIGTQCWMQSNLNVSRYRNGDIIPEVQDQATWGSLTTGAWCYYENNTANGVVYGKLYNWYAVNDPRGLSPEGWHIPTKLEWEMLNSEISGANALKQVAGNDNPSCGGFTDNATNQTGFSAVASGYRNKNDAGFTGCYYAVFWSSTDIDGTYSWSREINDSGNGDNFYERSSYNNNYGLSIRCIKD